MEELFVVAFGYLVGSIPFAFLLARRRGVDLRHVGSGNVGAANVLRTTGVLPAVLAMCLDALKGSIAVVVALRVASGPATPVAAALASVVGHIYPFWLGFKGGKGVATAAGAFGVLAPTALAVAGAVFAVAVCATRYVSVGSLVGAVTLVIATAATDLPFTVTTGAIVTAILIVYRHRTNLARLMAGTERRVGQRL
jgi:glycerol-3-phosphate acyltransferase PlsY